ncbi:MAG TPA: cysteine synthase family protein [Candidatus Woesearchaeota archaeon]|nr:cysteine synthase family protein [Candidatus Woesearchaeota archaeon]
MVVTRAISVLVGTTPLVEVDGMLAKLEVTNPTGSVKDRMAWHIVKKAEERGELKSGMQILEVTSGNTGISLAMISAVKGYKFTAVMPESMSLERRRMMKAFGATLVLTPAEEDMQGAVDKYNELAGRNPHAWLPKQFENPENADAHELGPGKEIIKQAQGRVDAFVAGIRTGGTLIGVARALKKANLEVRIIGVEPAESAVLSGKKPGLHKIQGIGEGFIPKLVEDNLGLIDEIIAVKSNDAIAMAKELAAKHGLLVGISSGANLLAAKQLRN